MIHLLANQLSRSISKRLKYSEIKQQWLRYGMENAFCQLFTFSLIFFISLFLNVVFEAFVFSLVFIALRKRTGGFHFGNDLLCSTCSIALCFGCIFLSAYIGRVGHIAILISLFIAFMGEILIIYLAPIRHPKLHLTESEIGKLRKTTKIICAILSLLLLVAFATPVLRKYLIVANTAIISVAILTVFAKLLKQEEKNNEQKGSEQKFNFGESGEKDY